MKEKNLFLCGFMGAGKTTVGEILAKKLGANFLDTDKVIENMQELSVKSIFQNYGERYFRIEETRVIKELCNKTHSIISLGGGALDFCENVKIIKSSGKLIFLDINFETALARLKNDTTRPILIGKTGLELQRLYERRKNIYLSHADIIIDANAVPLEVCNKIVQHIKKDLAELS